MGNLSKQFTFAPGPAASAKFNTNFDDIIAFINNSCVHTDGSKTMTAPLVLPDVDPTTANQATRKKYVDDALAAVAAVANAAVQKGGTTSGLVGTYSGQPLKVGGGFNYGSTDGAGDLAIPFSPSFNGILSVTCTMVEDTGDVLALHLKTNVSAKNIAVNGFKARVAYSANGTSVPNATVSICWTVVGW